MLITSHFNTLILLTELILLNLITVIEIVGCCKMDGLLFIASCAGFYTRILFQFYSALDKRISWMNLNINFYRFWFWSEPYLKSNMSFNNLQCFTYSGEKWGEKTSWSGSVNCLGQKDKHHSQYSFGVDDGGVIYLALVNIWCSVSYSILNPQRGRPHPSGK